MRPIYKKGDLIQEFDKKGNRRIARVNRYEHGTINGYKKGECRCDLCRAANSRYVLRSRRMKLQEPATDVYKKLMEIYAGKSVYFIAKHTGVSHGALSRIIKAEGNVKINSKTSRMLKRAYFREIEKRKNEK